MLLGDLLIAESCRAQDVADRYPAHAPLLAIAAEYMAALQRRVAAAVEVGSYGGAGR